MEKPDRPDVFKSTRTRRRAAHVVVAAGLCLLLSLGPGVSGPLAAQQEGGEGSIEERARQLTRDAILIDGHNDLPWQIRRRADLRIEDLDLADRAEDVHTDWPRMREGGVDGQFWAAYVATEHIGEGPTAVALEQIDLIKRMAEMYPEELEMAYTAEDIERIAADGRIASLIGVEGGHAISNSLPVLRELYEAGTRYMTLTHSATLAWADAAGDTVVHEGLTDFGEDVVREMNRLGMLVDLSHVSDDVMRDALDVSEAPVIFSHSSARAVADHPRNVPDDVLERMEENGGVVMVNFYSAYIVPEGADLMRDLFDVQRELREEHPDDEAYEEALEEWREENPIPRGDATILADHVDHMVQVAGIDHVGIGSDYDGVTVLPEGMDDVSGFPLLTEELLRRDYSEEAIRKILGENFLRAMREAEGVARDLRETEEPAVDRLSFPGLEPDRAGSGEEKDEENDGGSGEG